MFCEAAGRFMLHVFCDLGPEVNNVRGENRVGEGCVVKCKLVWCTIYYAKQICSAKCEQHNYLRECSPKHLPVPNHRCRHRC